MTAQNYIHYLCLAFCKVSQTLKKVTTSKYMLYRFETCYKRVLRPFLPSNYNFCIKNFIFCHSNLRISFKSRIFVAKSITNQVPKNNAS